MIMTSQEQEEQDEHDELMREIEAFIKRLRQA